MGHRSTGRPLTRRVTLRSTIAALPFWTLAGAFLVVCGFGRSIWGLDAEDFGRIMTFQLLAMHAGVFLGAVAIARPRTLLGHVLRVVAFAALCAAYSSAGHRENGVDGILLIWSLILLSCVGVLVGLSSENRGYEMIGRSVLAMVVLFLVLIPFGTWNVISGVGSVGFDEAPIIGAPYFGVLGVLEFLRLTPAPGPRASPEAGTVPPEASS